MRNRYRQRQTVIRETVKWTDRDKTIDRQTTTYRNRNRQRRANTDREKEGRKRETDKWRIRELERNS